LKISGDTTKIYSDSVFGGISWANDNSKICFIGEVPEPVSYKNPWDDKKEEKKEGDHYLDEKFNLKQNTTRLRYNLGQLPFVPYF
jgi:hypothetical protein